MKPLFFSQPSGFRSWLEQNHKKETEVLVGFYKIDSGKLSMTWPQSVDEVLCFGWIDGIRKSIDKDSYCIRFTPRKKTSIWSTVNITKVTELNKKGLMQPSGLEAFDNRTEEKSEIYSFESATKKLTESFENKFKTNKKAWDYFISQAASYKKTVIHWIMTARHESTQVSRLEKTIAESEKHKRLWEKYK
jgi:uncharacterized protein YdeI (YjbR/CyaY-like superfamily)